MTNHTDRNGKPAAAGSKPSPSGVAGSSKATAPASAAGSNATAPPKSWEEIRVGNLVIAQDSLVEGWWEATVTEVYGDSLTLRWRDYPGFAAFHRQRQQVALLFPGS